MDSRGAVILTNDGSFTNLLTHPRYGVEKTYHARVRGFVDDGALDKLRAGVWLAEGKTLPAKLWVVKRKPEETELGIAISEGKNRQVRRMLAAVGYKCQALTRTRIGPITLKGLREGDYRELSRNEVAELLRIAKKNAGAPPPPWARGRSSRARSLGKPDPTYAHDETMRREVPLAPGSDLVNPPETAAPHAPEPMRHAPVPRDDFEEEESFEEPEDDADDVVEDLDEVVEHPLGAAAASDDGDEDAAPAAKPAAPARPTRGKPPRRGGRSEARPARAGAARPARGRASEGEERPRGPRRPSGGQGGRRSEGPHGGSGGARGGRSGGTGGGRGGRSGGRSGGGGGESRGRSGARKGRSR
jgi:23S rRNA pseudouridine2605 synthase